MLSTDNCVYAKILLMSNMTIVNWIKNQMDIRGLNKYSLATLMDVSPSTVGRVLSGERNPGNDFLRAVASAFNMPDEEIFMIAGEIRTRKQINRSPQTIEFESLLRDIPEGEREQLMMIVRAYHKSYVR